jgi:hypothetical protein
MKCHASALRFAAGLCALAVLARPLAAQTAMPPYQDHYIADGTLKPDISAGDGMDTDSGGLARSLQIDGVLSALGTSGGGSSNNAVENGLVGKSQWETATYGAWSLDASVRTGGSDPGPAEQGQGGTFTLRQRGMPFDGGWQADNALGDLNAPDISLARFQPRFFLPTGSMQGLATEWHGPADLQVVAGAGMPGLYDGIVVPNFHTLGGSTVTAGAQWSPAAHWAVGGQVIDARDVDLSIGPVLDGGSRLSSSTELVSAAWQDKGERLQLNLIDGDVKGEAGALGAWIDGSLVRGRIQQTAGMFRIDPNLTWGNQLISNDAQGGYYRLDYQGRRWLADAGVDEVRSVSGLGGSTTFLTGDVRYQLSRDWGVGGVANASRTAGGTSWSMEGYVDRINDRGTGRAQVDIARTTSGQDGTFTLDQSWSLPANLRLSTSAWVERISSTARYDQSNQPQDSTLVGIAAYGGGQIGTRWGLEGNVRWAQAVQGRAAPGVSANVSLTWQLSRFWEILATYYDSRVGSWTPLTVISPLTPPEATVIPAIQERGIFLTFRFKRSAGLHFAPLGGAPGAGSGEIAGMVYLDANTNGRADAGEAGAANVTVVLDGRYSVQTDAAGRFAFPAVAAGHHQITVVSDNVPLPWTLVNDGRADVEVATRDRIEVDIAAQRPR